MSDDIKFKFDLDASGALGEMEKMKSHLDALAKGEQLMEMAGKIGSLLGPLGLVAASVFALKKAFDFAAEGEEVRKIENEFDTLATAGGIASEKLKNGAIEATKTFLNSTDALKLANKSIVELGTNAERIPELMGAARSVSYQMGKDFQSTYELMSQAAASGQTRMLRQLGINIDLKKTIEDYAKAHGLAIDMMTQEQRQQATLNAVIKTTKDRFGEVKESQDRMADASRNLKTVLSEVWDDFTKFVYKKLGPTFSGLFNSVTAGFTKISKNLKYYINDGVTSVGEADKAIEHLQERIEKLKSGFDKRSGFAKFFHLGKDPEKQLKLAEESLAKMKARRDELVAEEEGSAKQQEAATENRRKIDAAKAKENLDLKMIHQTKFEQELVTLKQSNLQARMALETDDVAHAEQMNQQRILAFEQLTLKQQQLNNDYQISGTITKAEYEQKSFELAQERAIKEKQLLEQQEQDDLTFNQNRLKHAQDFTTGFDAASRVATATAIKNYKDMGGAGGVAFNSINKGAVTFFKGLGEGSKSASELMKGFIFGSLADVAEAKGQVMLLESIWPPNPIGIAGGGALLALSGLLRSQAGGGSGGGIGGGTSAGAGTPSSFGAGGLATPSPTPQTTQPGKSVSIQFSGSYFETEQTQRRLVDLIRAETDATAYQYSQIPVA